MIEFIICLLCFLSNWYQEYLIHYFTIFGFMIVKLILCIFLIIFFIFIISNFKRYTDDKRKIIAILLLVISTLFLFLNFQFLKTKLEFNWYQEKRSIIIEKIKNNEFPYYYDRNIKLPIYKYVSSDGEVFVYQNDEEQVIGFWISRGVLSDSTELIYSSKDESLIYKNHTGHPITKVIPLAKHWYYVESRY